MAALETFYIDPDEEIPSIVSRLKTTQSGFLVFVIPQRAVLFSSVITMRLFKKEADRLGKDVFVVTQDEQGFDMARRVGFVARKSLEDLPFSIDRKKPSGVESFAKPSEENVTSFSESVASENAESSQIGVPWGESKKQEEELQLHLDQKESVAQHALPRFVEEGGERNVEREEKDLFHKEQSKPSSSEDKERDVQSELRKPRSVAQALSSAPGRRHADVIAPGNSVASPRVLSGGVPERPVLRRESNLITQSVKHSDLEKEEEVGSSVWGDQVEKPMRPKEVVPERDVEQKKEQRVFVKKEELKVKREERRPNPGISYAESEQEEMVGSRAQWIIAISFFVILGMIACIGIYLQSPEADIVVHLKKQAVSGDASYTARADGGDIATKFLEYDDTVTMTGDATGATSSSGTKARGMVTLYNAFSKESQALVATTRLQSPEGKIFRIVKSVTIPGFSEQDGQVQPGSVDVEIQADESGEAGNIGATKFTIPGFSGGPKSEKIYAESRETLHGGGAGDGSDRTVSQGDVATVKKKIERKVRDVLLEKAKTDMDSGMTSDDLIEVTFLEETSVPTVGTVAKTFDLTAKVQARYSVFSDTDARVVALKTVGVKNGSESVVFDAKSATLEYGKMSVDFEKKTVDIKMFVTGDSSSGVSLDAVREDILGKNESELQSVVGKYPQIAGFEVNLRKSYFQRVIPKDSSKVHITEAK